MNKIEYFINKGLMIYKEMPKGWDKLKGALTAPCGYEWIWNKKSIFSKDYKQGLFKKV